MFESLAQLSLFADLTAPQLEEFAHTVGEEVFAKGQRVLRQGISGGHFFVIVEGEARVLIDGQERPAGQWLRQWRRAAARRS